MSWVELIITFGISVGAVVWGFNIYHQRGTWFIAGWNTMRKETKATYNVQALCQLYGKCVMGCGLGLFLLLYGSFSGQNPPLLVGLGLFMVMVVLSILLPILNPKRYRK